MHIYDTHAVAIKPPAVASRAPPRRDAIRDDLVGSGHIAYPALWWAAKGRRDMPASKPPRSPSTARCLAGVKLSQELVRRNIERVDAQHPTYKDQWMRSHHVHNDGRAEFREIVTAHDAIVILRKNTVRTALVLDKVIGSRKVMQRPRHVPPQPCALEALSFASTKDLIDKAQHVMLIEASRTQVRVTPTVQR